MILITADIICDLPKKLSDYEQVYLFLAKVRENNFATVEDNRLYILLNNSDDYFKLALELILALNRECLVAKLYVSQSNEAIELKRLDVINNRYQVFKLNNALRKQCIKNRSYKLTTHFTIRASHQTLDSILYSLSKLCFKYERNLDMVYDRYYLKLNQSQLAEKYNMSQVAVSKKLRSNNYEMFKLIVSRL